MTRVASLPGMLANRPRLLERGGPYARAFEPKFEPNLPTGFSDDARMEEKGKCWLWNLKLG